jgi:hypothetical protein
MSNQQEIEVDDTVFIGSSEAIKMTVNQIGDEYAICVWHDGKTNEIKAFRFNIDALIIFNKKSFYQTT